MKSIKEMTNDVIDIVHENSYKEIEEWDEEDGHQMEIIIINRSRKGSKEVKKK